MTNFLRRSLLAPVKWIYPERATRLVCAATAFLVGGAALESTALAQGAAYNYISGCYDDPAGIAPPVCPNANAGNSRPRTVLTVDPCFIAQNAMRPCKSKAGRRPQAQKARAQ